MQSMVTYIAHSNIVRTLNIENFNCRILSLRYAFIKRKVH